MIQIQTIKVVDYVVIGTSGLFFLLFLACALYAVPWNKTRRKQDVTRDFNLFWKTRLLLQIASALWVLVQWLRLEALWQPGSEIFPGSVTGWTGNGTLCRLYICISMGLLEPFCLFTAVLLCRSVLSRRRPQEMGWPNAWVLGVALVLTVPFTAAQTVIAWISVIEPGHDWERTMDVGRYFLASYVVGTTDQCDNTNGQSCLLCFFPGASTIVAAISGALAALLLWFTTQRMINNVINRRLRFRLRLFQMSMITVMIASCATRAVTLARGTPFSWVFQMTWLAHFLTLPPLVSIYTLFLVVLPVWDTGRASKGLQKMQKRELAIPQTGLEAKQAPEGSQLRQLSAVQGSPGRFDETLLTVDQDKSELSPHSSPQL